MRECLSLVWCSGYDISNANEYGSNVFGSFYGYCMKETWQMVVVSNLANSVSQSSWGARLSGEIFILVYKFGMIFFGQQD